MPKDETIKCVELAMIKVYDDAKSSYQVLRVVAWNDGDPVVEKRWFYRVGKEVRTGRCAGLTLSDLKLVVSKYEKIRGLIERGDGLGTQL